MNRISDIKPAVIDLFHAYVDMTVESVRLATSLVEFSTAIIADVRREVDEAFVKEFGDDSDDEGGSNAPEESDPTPGPGPKQSSADQAWEAQVKAAKSFNWPLQGYLYHKPGSDLS